MMAAPFVGWQRQDNGASVQAALEAAAEAFIGAPTPITGAGRTDSGVHATGQAAHLDVPEKFDADRVMQALNAHLGCGAGDRSQRPRSARQHCMPDFPPPAGAICIVFCHNAKNQHLI
jgi:hypothetical protein